MLTTASKIIGTLYHIDVTHFSSLIGQGELYVLNFSLDFLKLSYDQMLQPVLRLVLQLSKKPRFLPIKQHFAHWAIM